MRKIFFYLCFVMCGCTHAMPLSGSTVVAHDEVVQADHFLTFERGAQQQSLRTHLEVRHDEVVLIGMGMLGEVLFECKSYEQNLHCDKIVSKIPAERLFADIQDMIWSAGKDTRFESELAYENKRAGYRLTLKPLNYKRGRNG